jgi:chromosome segregation ATPase
MNETAQAIADVKNDVAELWSAILNIHNKQKELGDKLEKIDSTTTSKLEKMQRDLSSIQSIEDAVEELRDQLDSWKETVSALQSDVASRSESSSFDEAVSSLTNKMELLSQRIQFAELNAKKMEETLLRRMKQFFVACKDMILGTVQEEDQDEEADNPSS